MYLLNFNTLKKYNIIIVIIILTLSPDINSGDKANIIDFNLKNKKLLDIIHEISDVKNINIILPQMKNQLDDLHKISINYDPKEKITDVDKAWELIQYFLNLSGYIFVQKENNIYEITLDNISREPLDIYINTNYEDLPNNNKTIRYIAYLKNIKIEDPNTATNLNHIFKDMLSPQAQKPIYLKNLNGYILADRADIIASIQNIITKLDEGGFQEVIQVIAINYVPASYIEDAIKILQTALNNNEKSNHINNFIANLKIVTDFRNNSLVIIGKERNVNALTDFISDYMDQPEESGRSILHYYNLEYTSSKDLKPVIQNIISGTKTRSQGTESIIGSTIFKKFQGVVIESERTAKINPIDFPLADSIKSSNKEGEITFKGLEGNFSVGGNRLIVLALDDDWKQIKKIIKQLDQPRPQVIVEALILDLSMNDIKALQSTTRTMTETNFLPSVNTQLISSNITPIQNVLGNKPQELAQDLLALAIPNSITSQSRNNLGSLLITFNDSQTPGIASIIRVLNQYVKTNVINHPFLAVLDNEKASVSQTISQRGRGESSPGRTGSFIIGIENIDATVKLSCIPHVIDENSLKLDIGIQLEDFIGNSFNKTERRIITTSNLNNNQVLAIGGLHETKINSSLTKTPLVGSIPIIGNLFKGEAISIVKTSILILIKPTIIMPKKKLKELEMSGNFVKDKLNQIQMCMNSNLSYNFTDPIVKFFVPNQSLINGESLLQDYIEETRKVNIIKNKNNINNTENIDFDKIKRNLAKETELF